MLYVMLGLLLLTIAVMVLLITKAEKDGDKANPLASDTKICKR